VGVSVLSRVHGCPSRCAHMPELEPVI
jgi:hypothetical protein